MSSQSSPEVVTAPALPTQFAEDGFNRASSQPIVVALAGPPNVGKSTVFNLLTGSSHYVGNWPGKPVEVSTGVCEHDGLLMEFIDLPGAYSLASSSAEEDAARDFLTGRHADVVVAILNSANLERGLYPVAELIELSKPIVIVLNMTDLSDGEGMQVEAHLLQAALGVPVVPMVATRARGMGELLTAIHEVATQPDRYTPKRPVFGLELERLVHRVEQLAGEPPPGSPPHRWLALKLLEGDREVTDLIQATTSRDNWLELEALLFRNEDAVVAIASARYEWIERVTRAALIRPRPGAISITERLDRITTNPIAGSLILFGLLGAVFWLVFELSHPLTAGVDAGLGSAAHVSRAALSVAPNWLSGLLVDGILGGVGTVLTLLPVLAIFFLAIGILEDIGYMPRAAFVADRFMHFVGLHGKSFLPLFLGFGCNVPAVLGARGLESKRAQLLTMFLAPFVPCAARTAVLLVIAGAVFGSTAPLIVSGLIAFNLVILALSGALINRLAFPGDPPALIMELPLYRLPNWGAILRATWHQLAGFLVSAGTIILVASVVVWGLATLPGGQIDNSYLAQMGRLLEPLGSLMGLDWRFVVALLTSFLRRENTLATLAVLTSSQDSTLITALPQLLTPASALALLAVQMLFIPCVATIAAIRQGTGSYRWMVASLVYLLGLSFTTGIVIYQAARILGVGV